MADDARTEARRRVAKVMRAHQRSETGGCACGFADWGCSHSLHVAGVVLDELFPTVAWVAAGENQMLMLRSWPPEPVPVEPVTEEASP